ncbi:MAG: DUF1963 domain-containing protein [Actinomycetales bacterium]|nr:DUF1963 domain-containing protein [Actinomycetales bacterium]
MIYSEVDPGDPAVVDQLRAAGLGDQVADLVALRRPSIRLSTHPVDEDVDEQAATGASRLGGRPDLPASFAWPRFRGAPLAFIAQVDLAEVCPFDLEGTLPRAGLLSFFYDSAEHGVWGFDPEDRGGWAVTCTPQGTPLFRQEFPDDVPEHARFGVRGLTAATEWTWASGRSRAVQRLLPDDEQWCAYVELFDEPGATFHRMLGHPEPVQGEMQLECQLVSNGLYCGNPSGYEGPRAEALREGAAAWRLLLQVDSEDDVGMMWGDAGRLYYWIRDEDLAAQNWDASWLILQCG